MKKINAYIENFDAPSAGYPYGRLRDDPGDGTGSEAVVATINDLISAIYAVVEAHKTGGVSDTAETTVASDLLGAINEYVEGYVADTAVKLTGAETVAGVKTFSSIPVLPASNPTTINQATRKTYVDGLDGQNVKLSGNQTIGGNKDFSGQVRPRTNPVTGSQSIAEDSYHTPIRGLYSASTGSTSRGGFVLHNKDHSASGASGSQGGPYTGNDTTRVYNSFYSNLAIIWYFARF